MYASHHNLIIYISVLLVLLLIYFKCLFMDTKSSFTAQLLNIFCLIYYPSKRRKSDSDLEKLFSHILKSANLPLPKIVLQTFPAFNHIDQRIRSYRRLSNNATPDNRASIESRTINIAYNRRLKTFRNMKRIADPRFDTHVLAYFGYKLFITPLEQFLICSRCRIRLDISPNTFETHLRYSPQCGHHDESDPSMTNHQLQDIHEISQAESRHTGSELPSPDRTATQITQQAESNPDFLPHHPENAHLTNLVERFSDGQLTTTQLAEIGFFYSSTNDRVCCYFCGGVLYEFRSFFSVNEEHASWNPPCPLGLLQMSEERNNSSQPSASNSAVNSTALNPSSSSALVPSFTPQTRQSSGLEDCTVLEPLQQAAVAASVASAQSTTDQKEATVPVSNTSQIRNQSRDPRSPALDVMMDPIHKEYIPASKRLDSFSAWPRKHLLRDPDLAEGGFNYADASNSTALSHTSVSSTPAEHRPSISSSTHNQQTSRDRRTNTPTSTNGQHASRDRPTNTPTSTNGQHASRDRRTNTPTTTNGQHASRDRPTPTYSELGILTERPKRADYALKVKRQESFAGWPRGHHLSVESLVNVGFYYGGYGDCARCFYCGGGLRNWEDEDDVLVEHARWFPKCGYLRQTLGQAFIDTVQSLRDRDQISLKLVADSMGVAESDLCVVSKENLTKDAAVRAVVDLGYLFADVLQAAELAKQEANILSADNIIEKLDLLGKRLNIRRNSEPAVDPSKILENIRAMKEENNQLRQQTVCKICMDKEVSVVFLPCGHLVSCGECAVAMRDCPVCRVNVKGIVKAAMG